MKSDKDLQDTWSCPNVYKTVILSMLHAKGPWNLVLSKMSMSVFGSCQMVLKRTNIKNILA